MSSEIHVTDVESFLRCRRLWDWQSMMRQGLQPAEMPAPLFLGQGVHVALDAYYSVAPEERKPYIALQAFNEWKDKRVERMVETGGSLWQSEQEMVDDMTELGQGMLLHYCLWAKKRDERYDFLATEQKFRIPMPMTSTKDYSSRAYPMSGLLKYAGRFDGVVRDRETGLVYLLEFKTSRSLHNMRYTYRGMQGTAYVWAASQLISDLTDGEVTDRVSGIMYRVLLKKLPDGPRPLVNGGYSQAKSQKTSFVFFKHCLDKIAEREERNPKELYRENENILRYLHDIDNEFFDETILERTPQQIESTMRALYLLGRQMADPDVPIFPTPGFHCGWCPFEVPCSVREQGGDYKGLLQVEYAKRSYWEESDDGE